MPYDSATAYIIPHINEYPLVIHGASPTAAGVMSAVDKAKLDAIPAGGGNLNETYTEGANQAENTMNLTAAGGGVWIRDNVVPLAGIPLFSIQNSNASSILNVERSGSSTLLSTDFNTMLLAMSGTVLQLDKSGANVIIDLAAAGALNIGTVTATSGVIGKSGTTATYAWSSTDARVFSPNASSSALVVGNLALSIGTELTVLTLQADDVTFQVQSSQFLRANETINVLQIGHTNLAASLTGLTTSVDSLGALSLGPANATSITLGTSATTRLTLSTTTFSSTLPVVLTGGSGSLNYTTGPGVIDARIYRSGATAVTVDDGAGGGVTFNVGPGGGNGTLQSNIINTSLLQTLSSTIEFANPIAFRNTQTLTGAGAVSASVTVTLLVTTGANALTLADGSNDAQVKVIYMLTDGGDGTLTPNNPSGYATITFNDVRDCVILMWFSGEGWIIIANTGCTVA